MTLFRNSVLAIMMAVTSWNAALAAVPKAAPPAYTAETAPDALGRTILAAKLKTLDESPERGGSADPRSAIHRNFPQLVEQNFARMEPSRLTRLLSNAQPSELSDLAQLYVNATSDAGKAPRLLDLLAVRGTPQQLALLAEHFGYAEMYAGIARAAPSKASAYLAVADPTARAPIPGETRYGPNGRFARGVTPNNLLFLDYTAYETYLAFRTAPIGALSASSALFATSTYWYLQLSLAWNVGFGYVGPVISALIQNYAPTLHDAIGAGLHWYHNALTTAPTPEARAIAEEDGAGMFQLGPISQIYEATGGDFRVTEDWQAHGAYAGGSGSGGGYGGGGWGSGGTCDLCAIP